VQGDLLNYSYTQMREHAQAALQIDAAQLGLWFSWRAELANRNVADAARPCSA
jgi:hypothetical protein